MFIVGPAIDANQPCAEFALLKKWQASGVKAVFLDTPPAISETIRDVVQLSDLVVVPTKPSPHDLRPELYRRLRLHAVDRDTSHQHILVAALEQYFR